MQELTYVVEGRVSAEGIWMRLGTYLNFEMAQNWVKDTNYGLHSYRIVEIRSRVVWPGYGPGSSHDAA